MFLPDLQDMLEICEQRRTANAADMIQQRMVRIKSIFNREIA